MSPRETLMEMVRAKLGPDAKAQQVIEHLSAEGLLDGWRLRAYVIVQEFFRRMRDPKNANAYDVEQDLAAEFDVTDRYVRKLRTKGLKKRNS